MTNTIQRVGIAEAALKLGLSYGQTQRLVLIGRLVGGRGESDGRWFVDADSLDREIRARSARNEDSPRAA